MIRDSEPNWLDRTTSLTKGVLGACPVAGPLLAEVIGSLIPNQRIDRIAAFTRHLDDRLKDVTGERFEERMRQPEMIDLLEAGFFVAAKSLSEAKIEHAAEVVSQGLTAEELDHQRLKVVLDLIGQLEDHHLLVLVSYTRDKQMDHEWHEKHQDLLMGPRVHLGSTSEEVDRGVVHATIKEKLRSLGLLRPRFKKPRRDELPEFDPETGMMKSSGFELTSLGNLVLATLGQAERW